MYQLRALKRVTRATSATAHLYVGRFSLSGIEGGGVIGPEQLETSS